MKLRPLQAVLLHFDRQTDSHEEDESLFVILWTRSKNRHTHTHIHTHSLRTQLLLSHCVIKQSFKMSAIIEVTFPTVHMLIYW